MKPERNSNVRPWAVAAVSAVFLVPLGVFGGPALGKTVASVAQYEYSGSSQYQYRNKVVLCHHTHSKKHPWVQISVGAPAVKAHRRHGDTLGPCPAAPPAASSSTGSSSSSGKSGDHGQSNQSHGQSDTAHGNSGASHGNGNGNGNGNGKGHNK